MKISVTVDRIQNDIATLIDITTGELVFNMPVALLPSDIKENDDLDFCITINEELGKSQTEATEDLLQNLLQGKHLR